MLYIYSVQIHISIQGSIYFFQIFIWYQSHEPKDTNTMDASSPTPSVSNVLNSLQNSNVINFTHPISIKLDDKNYLLWRQQVSVAIRGHDLQSFIQESNVVPKKYLTAEDEKMAKSMRSICNGRSKIKYYYLGY